MSNIRQEIEFVLQNAFGNLNNTSTDRLDYHSTIVSRISDLLGFPATTGDFVPTGDKIPSCEGCGGAVGGIWGRTGNSGMDKRLWHALGTKGEPGGEPRGNTEE